MLELSKSQPHKYFKIVTFVATDAERNKFFNGQLYKGDIALQLNQ